MSRFAGAVVSVFETAICAEATAVTVTGGVVKVPGEAPRLMPSAVFVAVVPSGGEPFGKRTSMMASPLLPAVSGEFITNCTRVRPALKFGVMLTAAISPAAPVGVVETICTEAGRRSSISAFRQGPDVL